MREYTNASWIVGDGYSFADGLFAGYDPKTRSMTGDALPNVTLVAKTLEAYGFAGHWAFRGAYPGGPCYGLTESQIDTLYGEADVLLNGSGAQEIRDALLAVNKRVYVESDPFSMQVLLSQGDP